MAQTHHSRKISRKELKQPDEFMTVANTVGRLVEEHLQKAIAGLVGLCLLAGLGVAFYYHRQHLADQAAQNFYASFNALEAKDYHAAQQGFSGLMVSQPDSEPGRLARFYLGLTYYNQGDLNRARDALLAYTQEAKAQPLHELALVDLADICERTGELDKAAQIYQEAIALKGPQSAEAQLGLARTLQHQGKKAAAIDAYRAYLQSNPFDAQHQVAIDALANLGVPAPAMLPQGLSEP